ncbi:MAG: hypothetical protein A2157_10275 [Deltaproteobacteria bacterium RBG_16_47_11]|nr:MAG: hypothetical protein A2157_10275 [Deltaproteobacteria bacterium RBG_16_47_11]
MDGLDEFVHTLKYSSAETTGSHDTKPDLYLVHPGGSCMSHGDPSHWNCGKIVFQDYFGECFLLSLLKTFSINPFQGQYPKKAVRRTATPISPRIHLNTPETKKERIIQITPMTSRETASPLATFFILTPSI